MKIHSTISKGKVVSEITEIKAHELRLITEGLMRMRNEMNERVGECDEKSIDLERFINKDFHSKHVRNCFMVRDSIDGMLNTIQNYNYVPVTES